MLAALAWRNLWRRPQRTILSLLSIAIVAALLVFVLSFQIGVYNTMKESTLHIFDGYAQIQPIGYIDDPGIDRSIPHPAQLAKEATAIDGVTTAAPRVNGFAILANEQRSFGAAVIGVDPASEAKISSIAATIDEGRYLAPSDRDTAILGDILARNLKLSVGEKVTLLGQARDGSVAADVLRVVGIYHSGVPELDRTILEMPLARAQDTFAMTDRANTIALGGPSLADVDAALPQLDAIGRQNGLSVLDWTAMEPALSAMIALKYATSMLFYLSLVVVVAFIILNTLLMSVLERTREFGTLLAVGMRPRQIGQMVWLEMLALALLGCAIGLAAGAATTLWFEHTGIVYPGLGKLLAQFGLPPRLYPSFTLLSASLGPAAILLSISLSGLVPYLRVTHLTPALAMRAS
jgi:ABC-type lipoprotein release transport system permease subunit